MHCTLLIPDLLPPADTGSGLYDGLATPALSAALARGNTVKSPSVSSHEWLCAHFGIARQHDYPLAALMAKADGTDPGRECWFCAEPVEVRIGRDRLTIARRIDNYTPDESSALLTAFNAHFNPDGLKFVASQRSHWYVHTPAVPDVVTTPLDEALNRSVDHHLPRGTQAIAWHRIMNEAQMILHGHPVNEAREARGEAVANSIWLWGGGTAPSSAQTTFSSTWGGHHPVAALSAAAGIAHHALPATANDWVATATEGHHLVVCDTTAAPLRAGDLDGWRANVETLDRDWIQPLVSALKKNQLAALTLVACNRDRLLTTQLAAAHRWRFWRPARALSAYARHD